MQDPTVPPPLDHPARAPETLERARRALIVRRLPIFASCWLATMVVWMGVMSWEGLVTVLQAAVLLLFQTGVLAATLRLGRRDPGAALVRPCVTTGLVLLGLSTAVLFARVGGNGDILAFVLLTLYLSSALFFSWGWRPALGVWVITVAVWAAAIPRLHFFLPTPELGAAIAIGSLVCLALAELTARTFGVSFRRGEREASATRALAASHDAYRDLAENASDLIYTHDLTGRLTYINEAFARFAGRPADDLIGHYCQELMARHPDAPDLGAILARAAAGDVPPPVLLPVRLRDGVRWLECAVSAIEDPNGTAVGLRGIARDVTARRSAEEQLRASLVELRRSEEMLRLLARRQASIREEERKRIGFSLHDDVCQELVGLGIVLESLRRRVADVSPTQGNALAQIGRYLNEVAEHLRGLAHDLRPFLLRDLGLEGSLRSLADGMSSGSTRVVVSFPAPVPRLDEEVEIGVYRIAQEALTNAARHAQATTITVVMTVDGDTLRLEVSDDGCGFVADDERQSHLGLVAMQERALALGGRVGVTSAPGHGTTVDLACPIAEPLRATGG
ncbi:MAG TPA: PAS domain-containing sensor histidine kinase [Candidatus Binatia bacterium]|jgi:PAS domain S-box-containing protein